MPSIEKIQDKNMTVCMLIWDYWPGREGGAQRQCRKLSHALARQGIKTVVVTQRNRWLAKRCLDDLNTRIVFLGWLSPLAACAVWLSKWKARWSPPTDPISQGKSKKRSYGITTPIWWLARFSFMLAASRYLRKQSLEMNLIHVHESNWIAGFASWIGSRTGLPALCKAATYPCLTLLGPDVPFRSRLVRWRTKPNFIALNNDMAAELKAAGIGADRIHVIPNGVKIPSEPAYPQNNRDVLFIANFTQGAHLKAYDILLKAWNLVRQQDPAARLLMIGAGDSRPWQNLARRLGCAGSVLFPGFASDPDRFYHQAAVFVLPSRKEGMSNALLEAQSWGIPAVVSAIPGNLAVVSHEQNGLVVPVNNAEELAKAIVRLLENPQLRTKLGNQARQRMIKDFSIESVSARISDLYLEITATGK